MLSVIVTNYNHGRFLSAALDALFRQTRPADEVIVIDDASTDDSIAVLAPFLDRFPTARLVQNAVNRGVVANLNRGLELTQGDIVLFAAADDVTYPRLLETGAAMLAANPQAGLFSARSDIIREDGSLVGVFATALPLPRPGYIDQAAAARLLMWDDGWFTGNTTIYRRDMLRAAGGFPAELGSFADGYVSRVLALRHGACFSPEVLGAWRRMEGGFAWSQTADLKRAAQLVAVASRRMAQDASLFPPGYCERWARRYLFGARRLALVQRRRKAMTGGLNAIGLRLREWGLTLWWFLELRPWDAVAVARRRLRVLLS